MEEEVQGKVTLMPDDIIGLGHLYMEAIKSGVALGLPVIDEETGAMTWDHQWIPKHLPPSPLVDRLQALEKAVRVVDVKEAVATKIKSDTFTEDEVEELSGLYDPWEPDLAVKVGEIYSWNGTLVEVRQAHTTQADWTPDVTPALWRVHRTVDPNTELAWIPGIEVEVGEVYCHEDLRYRVVQAHTTQADWTPDQTPALWEHIVPVEERPDYKTWTIGITVSAGDEYLHDLKLYRARLAHTTQMDWVPQRTPALWVFVADLSEPDEEDPEDPEEPVDPTDPTDPEEPDDPTDPEDPEDPDPTDPEDPEEPTGYPAWQSWTGNNADLYQTGDRVSHKGKNWEATTGNNHWEPGVFGWVEV